jgi:hypothetical protein
VCRLAIASQVAFEQLRYMRQQGLSPREMLGYAGVKVKARANPSEEMVRAWLIEAWLGLGE